MNQRGNDSLRRYQQRLERVLATIHQCLNSTSGKADLAKLDVNYLADVACLSPYHWHRVYHAMMGETLASTIKRVRLHQASSRLIYTQDSVARIASDLGYASVPSFSRAFRQHYQMPPAQYRREGGYRDFELTWNETMNTYTENQSHEVTVKTVEPSRWLGLLHIGSYMDIGQKFHQLSGLMAVNKLPPEKADTIAIYFDDPTCTPAGQLRSMACVSVPDENTLTDLCQRYDDVALQSLRGGEYAVLTFKGPYSEIGYAYGWLYGQWLPNSGREPAHTPVFERYLNNPRDVAPGELLTDIYLPLAMPSNAG